MQVFKLVYFEKHIVELLSTVMYSPVCYIEKENKAIMLSALTVGRPDFYFINTLPAVNADNIFASVDMVEFITVYKNQRISLLKLLSIDEINKIEKLFDTESDNRILIINDRVWKP